MGNVGGGWSIGRSGPIIKVCIVLGSLACKVVDQELWLTGFLVETVAFSCSRGLNSESETFANALAVSQPAS